MRIALIPSAFAPAVGGVEVLTARLAHQIATRGHEVEVWTGKSHGDTLPVSEAIDGVAVRRFVFTLPRAAPRSILGLPVAASSTFRQLRSTARRFRPDILHVQCFSGSGAYATALSLLTGTPLLVTLQGETLMDDQDIYEHSATLRTSLRVGLRRAGAVTACSAFTLRDAQERFGLDIAKARVIFNGVDLEETAPTPIVVPFDRYVLAIGRVVRKKGFDLLLDAFARIASEHPDVGLVIGGDGSERERLLARAQHLGLSRRFHLTGRLSRGEVSAAMLGAEMLVMPSRIEPFGIVALEAWRAGIPVIVTSRGGAPEFIDDGLTGLVVDPLRTAELGAAVDRLLRTPELCERLAGAGRRKVGEFAWSRLVQDYESLYRELGRS